MFALGGVAGAYAVLDLRHHNGAWPLGHLAVAASTLAATALFNPPRRRLQHLVDRRFNRARYDAEATLDALARRLREAVEPDTVETSLLEALGTAVQPAHLTIWVRETG
jgi:hypothetical protein